MILLYTNIKVHIQVLVDNIVINRMDNIFKNNSRFSVLFDDTINKPKQNKKEDFKKENGAILEKQNTFKTNNRIKISSNYTTKKDFCVEENNFPSLNGKIDDEIIKVDLDSNINHENSYLTKIKECPIIIEKPPELSDQVKPGWLLLKKNNNDNSIIRIYKTKSEVITNNKKIDKQLDLEPKEVDCVAVGKALVDLYEKRKQFYIMTWGEDEYERMFKMYNYDYEYFDKLDEKYEQEMSEESDSENEYDYIDDNYYNYQLYYLMNYIFI